MREVGSCQAHQHVGRQGQYTQRHHSQHADPFDQVACEKRRQEHAQYVPLNHRGRRPQRMAANLHGQRRGRHHHDHHGKAHRRATQRCQEHRLPHDLPQWARLARSHVGMHGRQVQSIEHGRRRHAEPTQHEERSGEGLTSPALAPASQIRPSHRGHHPTHHHP